MDTIACNKGGICTCSMIKCVKEEQYPNFHLLVEVKRKWSLAAQCKITSNHKRKPQLKRAAYLLTMGDFREIHTAGW